MKRVLFSLIITAWPFQGCSLFGLDDDDTPSQQVDDDVVFDDDSTATPFPTPTLPPTPTPVATPTQGTDSDGDGWTIAHGDCDDTDPTVYPGNVDGCGNGIDNDCDGFVDNRDDDLDGFIAPACGGNDCDDSDALVHPLANEVCGNGSDDDCSGKTDCDDVACEFVGVCPESSCTNSIDDDGDGLIDCDDPDCQELSVSCSQTYAGDCCNPNGTPGCQDNHANECVCASDPACCLVVWDVLCVERWGACGGACVAEDCANGVDDDGDGLVDCLDPICVASSACREGLCANGLDDDGDGLIDCADFDCVMSPDCYEASCADGLDNDGDGLVDCDDLDCVADAACVTGYLGSCCQIHVGTGCAGAVGTMQCVCAAIPSCCYRPWNAAWDTLCVNQYTGCGGTCP